MIAKDLTPIDEGATDIVYHYTNLRNAASILRSEKFQLTSAFGDGIESSFAPKGYPYFLSTSRSKVGGYHSYVGYSAVMFVLNGRKLSQRYKARPVDYWGGGDLSSPGRDSETEDRIFSKVPEIGLDVITGIHVLMAEPNESAGLYARFVLLSGKKMGVPTYLYTDEKSWRLQNTRRAIPLNSETAREMLKGHVGKTYYRRPARGVNGYGRSSLYSWLELLQASPGQKLSDAADRVRYEIQYYNDHESRLRNDIINARKPGNEEYPLAVRLVSYMTKNKLNIPQFIDMLKDKWAKKKQPVSEHSNWEVNKEYTEQDLQNIAHAATVVTAAARKMGVKFLFSQHFFDQVKLKRGIGKVDYKMIFDLSAKILKRGLTFFANKEDTTSYAFVDQYTGLIMEIIKKDENVFIVRTLVRANKWLGRSEKIIL